MSLLQPGLFCLKSLNLFIEFSNQPVLVRKFLFCFGKVSLSNHARMIFLPSYAFSTLTCNLAMSSSYWITCCL